MKPGELSRWWIQGCEPWVWGEAGAQPHTHPSQRGEERGSVCRLTSSSELRVPAQLRDSGFNVGPGLAGEVEVDMACPVPRFLPG